MFSVSQAPEFLFFITYYENGLKLIKQFSAEQTLNVQELKLNFMVHGVEAFMNLHVTQVP